MDLPSKALRDGYGIDSYERAIVWSALLLRGAYQLSTNSAIKDAVQSTLQVAGTGERLTENIIIRASLLVANETLAQGANILSNIQERFFGVYSWLGGSSLPSIGDFTSIVPEPFSMSLEQYFYWACQNVLKSNIDDYRKVQIIPIFRGVSNPFTLDCTITISFDYATYLETNNLVSAVGAVLPPIEITPSTGFNNSTQLNNVTQLVN